MRLTVISHLADTHQPFYMELERQGLQLQLIVPAGPRRGPVPPASPDGEGLATVALALPTAWGEHALAQAYLASLGRLFYLFQPDAIYVENEAHAVSTFQAAWANRLSVRRPFLFRARQSVARRAWPPSAWLERFVLGEAACANVVNEEAGARLRARGYKRRIAYMPSGIDPDFYQPLDARARRAEWGLPRFVFGYVGRLTEARGLRDLVEALRRFHPEEDVGLVVAGEGPLHGELTELFATPAFAGRAKLLPAPSPEERPALLSALDALVLPSRSQADWLEPSARVLLEGLACGVPVIGSSSGEIPHVLARLEAGLVFPEGDVTALASAMRQLLENPALHDRLRERGRREVEQQYSHEALAYRFVQLLGAVVGERARGATEEDALPSWLTQA